jgi:hypothetical protein
MKQPRKQMVLKTEHIRQLSQRDLSKVWGNDTITYTNICSELFDEAYAAAGINPQIDYILPD